MPLLAQGKTPLPSVRPALATPSASASASASGTPWPGKPVNTKDSDGDAVLGATPSGPVRARRPKRAAVVSEDDEDRPRSRFLDDEAEEAGEWEADDETEADAFVDDEGHPESGAAIGPAETMVSELMRR
jgi:hypothetical protein